jgi:hypothetical protein
MTTATLLLNIDLAAGATALVTLGMIAVPNIDRINALRQLVSRRPAQRARKRRRVIVTSAQLDPNY